MIETDLFKSALASASKLNEKNDCAVRAVSIAARVPYDVAHRQLAYQGRKPRGTTYDCQYVAALGILGFDVKDETVKYRMKGGKTIKTLARLLPSRGVFLIRVRGHIACYRAGALHDWLDPSRRHHVIQVQRVTKRSAS